MRSLFAAVLVILLSMSWILPAATAPVWKGQQNQGAGYPRQLLSTRDLEDIPRIISDDGFAIDRIALVEKRDGKTVLTDPSAAHSGGRPPRRKQG